MFLRMVSFNGKWIALSYISIYGFPRSYSGKRIHLLRDKRYAVQSLGGKDPLEKKMATRSSILVWKIRWTEEPGGYNPQGCKESDMTERQHTHTEAFIWWSYYIWWPYYLYTHKHIYMCVYMFLCSKFMPKYVASLFLKIV